ncbi:hypothetical protein LPTSP4_19710 [Leptospira ryugenii]|uniref:Uncharacterized protein n=1 Tax=Leptospira ryugenii TaxID=1917863 RepID=A0A2P2E0W8_9LEPT|nr:hypothetical protein LPTSP4_19710 [Leptospira ryugenii]
MEVVVSMLSKVDMQKQMESKKEVNAYAHKDCGVSAKGFGNNKKGKQKQRKVQCQPNGIGLSFL